MRTGRLSRTAGIAAVLLAGGSGTLGAQEADPVGREIVVGDPTIDTGRVAAGADTLELLMVADGEERPLSTLTRTVERIGPHDEGALRIVQAYASPGGVSVDTSVVLEGSFAPVEYAAVVAGEVQRLRFDPDRIHGTVSPADSAARAIDVPLEGPVFNAVVDRELIEALPLSEGFSAYYAVYSPPFALGTVRIRVTGSETLATAGGAVDAWVVDYAATTGAPGVLWMAKESGRFLRRRVDLPNGATWWMVRRADLDVWRAEVVPG